MSECKHYAQRVVVCDGFPVDFERICYDGHDPMKCATCKYFSERTNDRPIVEFINL